MMNQEHDFPVVSLVDALLFQAVTRCASDIHFEPTENKLRVRMRIDGMLYDQEPVDHSVMHQFLSRLKVLANINIAVKRVPQDGIFRVAYQGQNIDLRVSTFPTVLGEKIVVRILDRTQQMTELGSLGFSSSMLAQVVELLKTSSGFFLVSGPTGSGKTTTLYGAINTINDPEKNIITLEDPVEYFIPGISQGQIHPDAGFTFEKGIRAVLRQDPNVIMVGEIRDKQTAGTAIEAALTGHMVLSTIHTNDAVSVVMRLMDMGIEPFLINASVSGVLAQRLARKICTHCKISRAPTDQEKAVLDKHSLCLDVVYQGTGCTACMGLGCKGRIGIFELLVPSSKLRSLMVQHPSFDALYAQALTEGMTTLFADGVQKVKDGVISVQELMRVVL
jgi:type II secretory ATPase GspE/PulE/Tfp pilus assembly ATPase PilB-like protein